MATSNVGYETIGGTRLLLSRITHYRILADLTGEITALWIYMDTNNVSTNVIAGVYASSAQTLTGTPAALLATATPEARQLSNGNAQWVELALPTPLAVTSGTYYHISFGTSGGNNWGVHYDDNGGDDDQIESSGSGTSTLADPANISGPNAPWDISAYAVIDSGAGVTATPSGIQTLSRQFATIAAAKLGGVLQ